jgi:hypothetical protein
MADCFDPTSFQRLDVRPLSGLDRPFALEFATVCEGRKRPFAQQVSSHWSSDTAQT